MPTSASLRLFLLVCLSSALTLPPLAGCSESAAPVVRQSVVHSESAGADSEPQQAQKDQETKLASAATATVKLEKSDAEVPPADPTPSNTGAVPAKEPDLPLAEAAVAPIIASSGVVEDSQEAPASAEDGADMPDHQLRANPLRDVSQAKPEALAGNLPEKKTFGKGKHSGVPFDPIKENGPIFVGWEKPDLALVISGRQDGYLEPCGCAGLDRMKGGLNRKHSLFQRLRDQGWPVVGLDVGGLIKGFGRQAELKFHTTVEAMRKMGYDAITFGKTDLQLPAAELVSVAVSVDDQQSSFVAANVGLFGFESGLTNSSRLIEAGGRTIGVTAILGEKYQAEINNAEVAMAKPGESLAKIVPKLKEKADLLILLAHATKEESIAMAKEFPVFDIVVTSGGPPEPPREAAKVEGADTLLIEVGEKGMNVVVVGLYDDPQSRSAISAFRWIHVFRIPWI